VSRSLHQLEQAGALRDIVGLAFGRSPKASGVTPEVLREIVLGLELPQGIPVVAGLDFGHVTPLFTIPLGGPCRLDAEARRLEFGCVHPA